MIQHLACIMDGNRRWATQQSMSSVQGYAHGVHAMKKVITYCIKKEIPYLSLYTFSLENFNRTQEEKKLIFSALPILFAGLADELQEQDVHVSFIGDKNIFPNQMKHFIASMEEKTVQCTKLKLQLLFCYGGQQEIVNAAKEFAYDVQQNKITIESLTNEIFYSNYFWTKNIPYPEIIIRTGGHKRLSNFLLFQAAYAQIYFLDILWPDLSQQGLDAVFSDFEKQPQNFGR